MTKNQPFQLGSISTGTLRTEDLLPAFADVLEDLGSTHGDAPRMWDAIRKYRDIIDADALDTIDVNSLDEVSDLLNETMFYALQELCPPFVYFGSNPGDGADFGFWPDIDALEEALRCSGPCECDCEVEESGCEPGCASLDKERRMIDADTTGQYQLEVHVNDHGNVTVMDMDRNVIWSVV